MKKLLLFAAVAGLGLVSASPPGEKPPEGAREAHGPYPPCTRQVRDSCTQLGRNRHRDHARHYAARTGGGHQLRTPTATDRQLSRRVRRAGERG
jgi:hypothetical protein